MRNVTEPVTLTPEAVRSLLKDLSQARHDVNNSLALISAAVELIKMQPESLSKLLPTLSEQPDRIAKSLSSLSVRLEQSVAPQRA